MKYLVLILSICSHSFVNGQGHSNDTIIENESINQMVKGYFDQDSILDLLIVFSSSKNIENGGMRSVIYLGDINNFYNVFYESRNIFPKEGYIGRSDNLFDTLVIENNSIIWRTCSAPLNSSSYSIETFKFGYFSELHDFKLTGYEVLFYSEPQDDVGISITLDQSKLTPINDFAFNMTDWLVSGGFFSETNIKVYQKDILFWNEVSTQFERKQEYFKALSIQKMILFYFPKNKDSLKKLGDYSWEYGDYDDAKKAYTKYLDVGGCKIGKNNYISKRMSED